MLNSSHMQKHVVDVTLLPDSIVSIQVTDTVKAKLTKNLDHKRHPVICCLTCSGTLILTDASGSGTSTPISGGTFSDFAWEETSALGESNVYRLLTVGSNLDLRVYVIDPENLQCISEDFAPPWSSNMLKETVECKIPTLTDLASVRLLSFADSRCILLLNSCVLVQLLWDEDADAPEMISCCTITLPPDASQTCTDYQICQGILFVLTDCGVTYMFDIAEGRHLATVDFALPCKDPLPPSSFSLLQISQDLSTAVTVTSLQLVIAVDLHEYFRRHPDHLLCQKAVSRLPLKPEETSDQEDVLSSFHSHSALDYTFHSDCSWESQLTLLNSRAKTPPSLLQQQQTPLLPWYRDFPPTELRRTPVDAKVSRESERLGCEFVIEATTQAKPVLLSLSKFSAVLTLTCPDSRSCQVIFMDLETQSITYYHTDTPCLPVQLSFGEQHCLLLKDAGLSLVLFDLSQEELLNRLMVFGSAGTVDSLCHLNAWGRCSIPVHALQAGLKNHQLDTVDFFLKSKENIFCPHSGYGLLEPAPAVSTQSQLQNVEELCPALDLLCSAIRETYSEAPSKQFSEQLLSITYQFLSNHVQNILSGSEDLDENLQNCVKLFNGYVSDLRNYMRTFPSDSKDDSLVTPQHPQKDVLEDMQHLPIEELVKRAVPACQIPLAQACLRQQVSPERCLQELKMTGLLQVYHCLQTQDLTQASALLRNMGYCVKEQLYNICLHTEDKALRQFVVEKLKGQGYLSEEELLKVDLLTKIEEPTALVHQPLDNRRFLELGNVDLKCKSLTLQFVSEPSDRPSPSSSSSNLCSLMRLDWVRNWGSYTQTSVLLSQDKLPKSSCESEILWRYLTSHHEQQRVMEWMESVISNTIAQTSSSWPTLTADIVSSDTRSNAFLRKHILDLLARQGEFVQEEMESFEQLLWRLGQTGRAMQVSQMPSFSPSQKQHFLTSLITHCLEVGLGYLLYTHVDSNRYDEDVEGQDSSDSHPCFEMLVKIQEISKDLKDPGRVFEGSLTSARVLIAGSQGSVSSMLLEGHSLLALSSIMFAPGGIDQISQHIPQASECQWRADPQLLKMALGTHPKLKYALFPPSGPLGIGPSDVSVYHLLQSLQPLDASRLFWWQSANTLGTTDMTPDLPHFSTPYLVNKYALLENLDFLHHLRHGRPSFAYGTFLVQHLANVNDEKPILSHAAELAYALGVQHFDVPHVAAACVCFCELLGVCSLKLRVDIRSLQLIYRLLSKDLEGGGLRTLKENLAGKCNQLLDSEWRGLRGWELLSDLEKAVNSNVGNRCPNRSCYEALQEWCVAVQFSQQHGLPLTSVYPRDCAADGEWLHLLLFVQQHSYPPQQVRALVTSFSPALQSHLSLAFQDLQAPLPPRLQAASDGLLEPVGGPLESCSGGGEEEYPEPPKELFQVLLQGTGQTSPWRHQLEEAISRHCPPLAVFASCEKESVLLQFLSVWLLTSVDVSISQECTAHINESLSQHHWNLHDLSIIWKVLLKNGCIRTLIHGFQLFLKKSPLLHMLNMYQLCCEAKKYTGARKSLSDFQKCLIGLREGAADQCPAEVPLQWVQSQASALLLTMIQQSATQYELRKLLKLLSDMGQVVKVNGPDVKMLSQLSQILQGTPVCLSPLLLERNSPDVLQGECQRMLQELQALGYFSQARQVADLAHLSIDTLVITELQQHMQTLKNIHKWERKDVRLAFLRRCHDQFISNKTNIEAASGFFLSLADQAQSQSDWSLTMEQLNKQESDWPVEVEVLSQQECCVLFSLAGFWLSQQELPPVEQLEDIEMKLWRCQVHWQILITHCGKDPSPFTFITPPLAGNSDSLKEMMKEFSFSKVPVLCDSKYLSLDGLPSPSANEDPPVVGPQDVKEQRALSTLLGHLLDDGHIHEASRVCRYFSYYHRDVWLVLQCRGLASGECQGSGLQDLLNTETKKSLQSYSSLGNLSSFVVVPSAEDQVVSQLQVLVDECRHGKNYCKQVLSLYELAKELKCSYSEISGADTEAVLQKILSSQQPDRYKTAQVFINVQGLQPDTVAQLVSSFVVQEIRTPGQDGEFNKHMYDLTEGREAFRQLAKLCGDPNLMGSKLLDHISTLPLSELSCVVELLILAHDCFSLSCNMEGIVQVLQAARHISHAHLAHSDCHSLLVRLLTGIGRYNEMTYIFDLLNQNHCFEMLLRKKVDTVREANTGLKMALLDYLKRCLPCDSEKHNMVALCFRMSREIGENHEGAARAQLKLIEAQPWVVTAELKSALMKVQTLFKDAAESLFKDSCVRQAVRCVRMAKLVTLQLHLLGQGHSQRLVNLQPAELHNTILELPHCYQVFVITDAYDFSPDWAEVLYQKVILKGDFFFLEEFKLHRPLPASLFEEISKKLTQNKLSNASQNLKKLLHHCEDIYTRYKLAYDHKFFDVANTLLQDSKTSSYLNDRLIS
ncbi:spatacsin isoform X2 [Engraulis encrasicolus]|uniref:spatacsin isoform X2 n=1 Tax=Engraulis encrasicolus TaxID=184585 RepID=UPI002FD1D716